MSNYPKSEGAAWLNNDKRPDDKLPDFRGKLDITKAQVDMLMKMAQAGQEPKLQIGIWKRMSEAGAPYVYLQGEAYMKQDQQQQQGGWGSPAPQPPQAQQNQQGGWDANPPQQQAPQQQQGGWDTTPAQPAAPKSDWSDDDIPF